MDQTLEYAKDKIMMGAERKSAVITQENMYKTAYHEAGHALVGLKTEGSEPIHKATVMPRGRALGMVLSLPDGDQTSMSRKQYLAHMDVCMGGRIAEELIFGAENITSGASSDIEQATRIAYAMVKNYGFSDKIGIMHVDTKSPDTSGTTKQMVDEEVRILLKESYARATKILETHRKDLDILAQGLLKYETLSGGELVDLLAGKQPNMSKGAVRSQRPSRAPKALPIVNKPAVNNSENSLMTDKSPSKTSRGPVQATSPSSSVVRSVSNDKSTASGPEGQGSKEASKSVPSANKPKQRGPPE